MIKLFTPVVNFELISSTSESFVLSKSKPPAKDSAILFTADSKYIVIFFVNSFEVDALGTNLTTSCLAFSVKNNFFVNSKKLHAFNVTPTIMPTEKLKMNHSFSLSKNQAFPSSSEEQSTITPRKGPKSDSKWCRFVEKFNGSTRSYVSEDKISCLYFRSKLL